MISRHVDQEGHLLTGAAPEPGHPPAGGVDNILERPAVGRLPEFIRIVDSDEEDVPDHIPLDEEEVGEAEVGIPDILGEDRLLESDDVADGEGSDDEDSDDEDSDDEDWNSSSSEDSGYETMYDDEEEAAEDNDEEDVQPFLQGFFQPGWREEYPPDPISPLHVPQNISFRSSPEGIVPGFPQWEESAPSTSGLGSPAKRSREEGNTEQGSPKRQRWNSEEDYEHSAPSTSGLGSLTHRSPEESYRESAPSTSGHASTSPAFWRSWMSRYEDDDSDSD